MIQEVDWKEVINVYEKIKNGKIVNIREKADSDDPYIIMYPEYGVEISEEDYEVIKKLGTINCEITFKSENKGNLIHIEEIVNPSMIVIIKNGSIFIEQQDEFKNTLFEKLIYTAEAIQDFCL